MGSVVKFPGSQGKKDLEPEDLSIEDATVLVVSGLDEHLIPIYEQDDAYWFGVAAFWSIEDTLYVRLFALFRERNDALAFACVKHPEVDDAMDRETITELRKVMMTVSGDDETLH